MTTRPRQDMMEWEEASSAASGRMAYALWLMLWHTDSKCEFGDLLRETRSAGYDGELVTC